MKAKYLNRKNIIICIECLLIIVCSVLSFDKINFPTVINDEFGYLGNAAYFAGYSWKSILSDVPYYSYGYSLFLIPLYIMFDNGVNIYYGVYVINIMCMLGSFLLINYIVKELFPDISWELRSGISLISALNVYTFVMIGYAMAENILFFSVCLTFAYFIFFLKKPTIIRGILLGSIVSFTHLLHQRALALVVAMIIIVLVLGIINKSPKRVVLVVIISIVFGLILQTQLKSVVKNAIWNGDSVVNGNDYSGVLGVIWELKNLDGILNFIFSLISKFYAVTVSYFFIPLFFVEFCIKRLYLLTKNKFSEINNSHIIYFTLFLTLIFATGISTLFALYPIRKDSVIFTRYIEYMLGPVMAIGLCEITKIKFKKLRVLTYFLIALICCPFVTKALSWVLNDEFIEIASPILSIFNGENRFYIYLSAFVMTIIFCFIYFILSQKKIYLKYILIFIISISSVIRGYNIKINWNNFDRIKNQTYEVGRKIENILSSDNIEYKVYIVRESDDYYTMHYYGGFIQQYLPRVKMEYIDINDIYTVSKEKNKLIVSDKSNELDIKMEEYKEVYSNDRLSLYKCKGD